MSCKRRGNGAYKFVVAGWTRKASGRPVRLRGVRAAVCAIWKPAKPRVASAGLETEELRRAAPTEACAEPAAVRCARSDSDSLGQESSHGESIYKAIQWQYGGQAWLLRIGRLRHLCNDI